MQVTPNKNEGPRQYLPSIEGSMMTIPTQTVAHFRLESQAIYATASRYESPQMQQSPSPFNLRSATKPHANAISEIEALKQLVETQRL